MSNWKPPAVSVGDIVLVKPHPKSHAEWALGYVLRGGVQSSGDELDHISVAMFSRRESGDGHPVKSLQKTCWHETDPRVISKPNAIGEGANYIWKASPQMELLRRLTQENKALVKQISELTAKK